MKATFWIVGILVAALGVWKMVDDLVVFRRTVEARFAKPPRALAQREAGLRKLPRRVSQEAVLPQAAAAMGVPVRGLDVDDPMSVEPAPSLLLPADGPGGVPRSRARIVADNYVDERRRTWGVREYHELRGEEFPGPMGTEVRYKVYQDGLEVLGLELRVEVDRSGNVAETGNNYLPVRRADLSVPELAPDEALRRSGVVQETEVASAAMNARRVLFAGPGADEPEVGFTFSLDGDPSGPSAAIVRAADGQPLARNFARR